MNPGRVTRHMLQCLLILGAVVCMAGQASADRRHHITIGLGYTKLLSEDLKVDPIDLTNGANAVFAYRYSISPQVDLTIDSRATASIDSYGGADFTVTSSYFGPGIRWRPSTGAARLYLQGNVFLVNEDASVETGGVRTSAGSEGSAGFGIMGGVDLRLSDLLSLPLEVNYLYGKPADDMSGVGFTVGLTFNFGEMP